MAHSLERPLGVLKYTHSNTAWVSEDDTSDEEALLRPTVYGEDGDIEWDDEVVEATHRADAAELAQNLYKEATTPRSDGQLDCDEDYCLVHVQSDEKRFKIVTVLPREWRFLVEYLYCMGKSMTIEDATRTDPVHSFRIGREQDDLDWRINFRIPRDQYGRLRSIRESIVLQVMMAHVDYAAWVKALLEIMNFQPPPFLHLDSKNPPGGSATLHRRFCFSFSAELELPDYEWHRFVKELFQPWRRSYDMMWTYCSAYQVMTAKGFDMAKMEPIPVKLRFAPKHCGYFRQIAILKAIMKIITKAKTIVARWTKRRQWRACPQLQAPPVFQIECIDLDLRAFTVHPSVLHTVEKFVATSGVRIENLTLPSTEFDGNFEETQLRSAWASLLCTVMGIEDVQQGSRAVETALLQGIDQLVVPSSYLSNDYYVPLLMAARDARRVKSLRIEMDAILKRRRSHHDRCIGALVGYAFVSKDSRGSITSLDIDQMVFSSRAMSAIERVVAASALLKSLYHEISGVGDCEGIAYGRRITFKMGTVLTPCWGSPPGKTCAPWTGMVVDDNPHEATMVVYLPGYGLCDIERSHVPNKKRKTTAADAASTTPNLTPTVAAVCTPLRHLSIGLRPHNDTYDDEVNCVLDFTMVVRHLGVIVGRELETLRLASDQATEDTLREILEHYKKLHSLCLLDAKLEDLSGLVVAYHEGSQISSLDLSGCRIPSVVFKALLRWLTTDAKVKSTLRRLRFGKNWKATRFDESTVHEITSMLKANKQLSHLHVHIPAEADMWKAVTAFQGEQLPGWSLSRRHQLAFASVFDHRMSTHPPLDADLMGNVFSFVAPAKRRTVNLEAPPPPPVERDPYLRFFV